MKYPLSIQSALLMGYSVFTTFTIEKNRVKGFSKHIERLQNNSKILFGITPSRETILKSIHTFIQTLSSPLSLVRVAIFPEDFNISRPGDIKNVQIITTGRPVSLPEKPLSLQLYEMIRPLPHLKTSNIFESLQTRKKAQENGYSDSVFFYEDTITEGPAWNIVFGTGDSLFFPDPSKKTFLEGFTQTLLKEYLPEKYRIITKEISKKSIADFEYCFIVSSGVGIIPVKNIESFEYTTEKVRTFQKIYNDIEGEKIL